VCEWGLEPRGAKGFRWGQLRLNKWHGRGKKGRRAKRAISACWCQNNKLFYNAWDRQRTRTHTHNRTLKDKSKMEMDTDTHTEAFLGVVSVGEMEF